MDTFIRHYQIVGPAAVLQLREVLNIWVQRLNENFAIDCWSEEHFILTYLMQFLNKLSQSRAEYYLAEWLCEMTHPITIAQGLVSSGQFQGRDIVLLRASLEAIFYGHEEEMFSD